MNATSQGQVDLTENTSAPRRREPRIKTPLSVRIWGMDASGSPFVQTVLTLDISISGACVAGVATKLNHGEIIGLQYGTEKARFRVMWTAPVERAGYNVGLSLIDAGKCMWRSELAVPAETHTGAVAHVDRRHSVRFACNGSAELREPGKTHRLWGTITDLSGGGCYVQTVSNLPVGTHLEVTLTIGQLIFSAKAEVRASHPAIGMGLQFGEITTDNRSKLHIVLERLEMGQADRLPPHVRVLSQIERLRETLKTIEDSVRRDPTQLRNGSLEMLRKVNDQVREILQLHQEPKG